MKDNLIEDVVADNEETSERIRNKVYGTVILSKDSLAIQSSFDNTTTQGMANFVAGTIVRLTRSAVRDIDPEDDLAYLRIYTKKGEWMIGPDKEFTLLVQQQM
ncbi:unnamed protein product [Hermetia illucens]|uniref:Roadblock/LAMTOR2 domain-containing protein n=1 Tax=Hermetia illucens TaxID=343691 RepID=A0A7R8UY92_HERIL|nr:dynein light chain roadblock-type 1-like [Hermetia illucens]CAD7088761.1 unnamed protein product [Hermetia illucens]